MFLYFEGGGTGGALLIYVFRSSTRALLWVVRGHCWVATRSRRGFAGWRRGRRRIWGGGGRGFVLGSEEEGWEGCRLMNNPILVYLLARDLSPGKRGPILSW
jgi:hypothetical protein